MLKVGFDRVDIDPMGNVLGYIGNGKHLVAMDAHIDTVGIGERKNWNVDPYKGSEEGDVIKEEAHLIRKVEWLLWFMPVKLLKKWDLIKEILLF